MTVFLNVKPFLSFYEKYQTAEDDSIEIKLIKGIDTTGKMNFICGTVHESLLVELSDRARCNNDITVRITNLYGSIQKEVIPGEVNMDRRVKKSLEGQAAYIEWLEHPGSFVSNLKCSIVKNVINEGKFIDSEEFNGEVEKLIFPDVSDHVSNV